MKKTFLNVKFRIVLTALFCTLSAWAQVDLTSTYIVNPEPTSNTDGWILSTSPTMLRGDIGVAEFWNQSGASLRQTINSLPAGSYKLTAIAFTRTGMTATLFAGSNSMNIATVSNTTVNSLATANTWFNAGNGVNELLFTVPSTSDVTIGLQADDSYSDHWMVWRSFKLESYNTDLIPLSVETTNGGQVTFGNSSMTGSQTFYVPEGDNVVLTITPNAYYELKSVILNGTTDITSQVANGQLILSNITAATTLEVTFGMEDMNWDSASTTTPLDITRFVVNPDFEELSANGWTITYTSSTSNTRGYQNSSYTNGNITISHFIEAWRGSNVLGDGSLQQTINDLPQGTYLLEADAIANNNATGAYLFMQDGDSETRTAISTDSRPLHFSVTFTKATTGPLTIGVKTVSTTANWIAADNFKLKYLGSDGGTILSNNKAYTLSTSRGSLGVNSNQLVATTAGYEASPFALISYNNQFYLYSVAAGAFVNSDGTLTNTTFTPITIEDLGNDRFMLKYDDSHIINMTTTGIYINSWSTIDAGNSFQIIEAADFDPTTAIAQMETAINEQLAANYNAEYANYMATYTVNKSSLIPSIGNWNGGLTSLTGQHWNGTSTSIYYEQSANQWGQSSWTNSSSTSLTLPAGKYLVMVAGRAASGSSIEAYMQLNESKVTFPNKGDIGFGVDVNGVGTMATDATYANSNQGRGWEYRYIAFESDGTTPVTLTLGGVATAKYQWMSFSQPILLAQSSENNDTDNPDANYERALAAIQDGASYRICTDVNGTKYYVTEAGLLTSAKSDGGIFTITKVSGGAYKDYGFRIDSGAKRFTNPPLSSNTANLTPGVFATSTNSRVEWESQVLFLNPNGQYAIRSCNTAEGTNSWQDAGRTYWTWAVESVPTPQYTYDPTYVWQIEATSTLIQVTYELYDTDGLTMLKSITKQQEQNSTIYVPAELTNSYAYDYVTTGTIGTTDCTIKVTRTAKSNIVHALSKLSNAKAYTIHCDRGSFLTDGNYLVSTSNSSYATAQPSNFAILNYQNKYYLYSVSDKKFVTNSGTLADAPKSTDDAIIMEATTDPYFFYYFSIDGTDKGLNTSGGYTYGLVINNWMTIDAGNQYYMVEAADFDATAPLAVLESKFNPSSYYVTYVVKDTAGKTLLTSDPVETTLGATITTLPTEYQRAFTTYNNVNVTISQPSTTIEFTATSAFPFEVTTSLTDIKWYNMNVRGSYWVTKDDTEPYYPKQDADLTAAESQWAFFGDAYNGIYVFNKSTGVNYTLAKEDNMAVMRLGVYSWDIDKNSDGFILKEKGTDYNCIHQYGGPGGPLQFWNSSSSPIDSGSTFRVEPAQVSGEKLTLLEDQPLITDVNQLSSPYTETSEGSLANLIDSDATTYWHSSWKGGSVTPGLHYFQATMPDGEYSLVAFRFTRRNSENDHTIEWSVRGTNDTDASKDDCEELLHTTTPYSSNSETLTSKPFVSKGYKYLRFYSEAQDGSDKFGSRGFFHLAEFQLYPVGNDDVTYLPLTITANGGGWVNYSNYTIFNDSKTYSISDQTNAVLSFTPSEGYELKSVTFNGIDVTNQVKNGQLTLGYITAATTVEAIFGLIVTPEEKVTITAKSFSRVYGEVNPTFTYTSAGGTLNGTPTLTCTATATSPVGTYDIIVAKGSVTNSDVELVNGTLTITKAPLTITVKSATKQQGEANPTFELTYSGFKNGETEAVLTKQPNITCSATTASPKGTYPITLSGAVAENYNITYVSGTLTVNEVELIPVTAESYIREYGEANPVFDFFTDATNLGGTPTITCEATAKSPVGTYPIVISQGNITRNDLKYVNGTLTITKAPLKVSVKNASRYIGEENPTFELVYSGFKNDETEAVLTKKPVATCQANDDSGAGTYTITISGGEATNYTLSYETGTLTVDVPPTDIFVVDNMTFQVSGQLATKGVTFVKGPETAEAIVPESITYKNDVCPVTAVADGAFANRPQLKSVKIPAAIKTVGKDLFTNSPHLAAIIWEVPMKMTKEMAGSVANNPNLLFYTSDPSYALDGVTNIVNMQTKQAERIVLTDAEEDNDFYCPEEFKASEITYTHEYKLFTVTGNCQGWETLALPFNVTEITHEKNGTIVPFGSLQIGYEFKEDNRPFWLYEYTTRGTFAEAENIKANVPYIISMPNEHKLWEGYILKGKVTFKGTNTAVKATSTSKIVKSGNRNFTPNYQNGTSETVYLMNITDSYDGNPKGSVFVQSYLLERNARPFEAYFELESSAGVKEYFGIFEQLADEIRTIEDTRWREKEQGESDNEYYQLDGTKRTKPQHGFNIVRTKDGKTHKLLVK